MIVALTFQAFSCFDMPPAEQMFCGLPCRDAHVTAVTSCCFLEGQGMMALTADSRGRLVFHNVSGYLSLTAMLAGAEPVSW